MKFAFRLGLILFIAIPADLSATIKGAPQDCVICGHACCCPEMCAPKIAELKARERAARLSICEREAACRIDAADNAPARLSKGEFQLPPRDVIRTARAIDQESDPFILNQRVFRPFPKPSPPVPPPRVRS